LEMTIPIFINDIQADLLAFVRCRRALQNLGIEEYPCQVFKDDVVPLDWLQVANEMYALRPTDFTQSGQPWYRIESFRNLWGHNLQEVSWQEARGFLKAGLKPLIAVRAAVQNLFKTPKCGDRVNLTVTTNTPGLQILQSRRVIIKWEHFGYPTPRVENCIPAGDYYFKARKYEN